MRAQEEGVKHALLLFRFERSYVSVKIRGRPRKPDAKIREVKVRMSEAELFELDYIAEKEGVTRPEVLRKGLRILYNLALHQK